MRLRLAAAGDIPAIEALIAASVRGLQPEYTEAQREAALGTVFGVDRNLLADGTYFVVETEAGSLAACGGWSRRATLFGSSAASPVKEDRFLDPAREAARIRAFFVHPAHARRGLGSQLLNACEAAARAAGFTRFELGATLAGLPLYERHGYRAETPTTVPLPNGDTLTIVRMTKAG